MFLHSQFLIKESTLQVLNLIVKQAVLSYNHGNQHHIRHPKIQHPKLKDIHKLNNIEKKKDITKKLLAKKKEKMSLTSS